MAESRRAQGTGSIREREPGVWELRYRNKSRTFRGGQRGAGRALSKMVTELAPAPRAPQGTVGAVLERYMERAELSPTTRREYGRIIARRLMPTFGTMPVEDLTTGALSTYYDKLRGDLAPSSVRQVHTVLRSAFKMALGDDEVQTNPAIGARLPKRRRATISVPSVDEVQRLTEAASPRISRAIRVLAGTGMRRGELLALRWQDVDPGVITVRHSVAVVGRRQLILKPTKTHAVRRVPVGVGVMAAIEEAPYREGFVFSDLDGEAPWNPDWLSGSFRNLCESLNIEATLHGLRHFHITQLLQHGVPFQEVADRVGHEDSRMTLVVYRESVPDRSRDAADIMDNLFPAFGEVPGA